MRCYGASIIEEPVVVLALKNQWRLLGILASAGHILKPAAIVVGRFWGYGDRNPSLIVLCDSLCGLRSTRGRHDAVPILWHCLCDALAERVLIVAQGGARAKDYVDMARECMSMQASRALLINMGNDLLSAPVDQ